MKYGDLVKLVGSLFSTWSRQDEVGIVVSEDHFSEGFLVCFGNDGIQDFSGYEDHFEVMNAS